MKIIENRRARDDCDARLGVVLELAAPVEAVSST
jgi:hypothetical protein